MLEGYLDDVWLQAMELNSIVADMFKTAYICRHYRPRDGSVTDWQGENVAEFHIPDSSVRDIPDCRGRETSLRPPSAVSASSSSDSATEANVMNCTAGDGLGSVSSITESVNSWSFRFPEVPRVASVANDAAEEKSTLLVDSRRPNVTTSADTSGTSSTHNVHPQVSMSDFMLTTSVIVPSLSSTRYGSPFPRVDIIRAVMIVWRVRGKIIRSLLCNIVCDSCTVQCTHIWTDLTVVCWLDLCCYSLSVFDLAFGVIMVALCYRADHYIFALWFLSIFFFYSSPNLSACRLDVYQLPYFHTWCGPSANLECRSEMCCI